jgi:hypothetical protein
MGNYVRLKGGLAEVKTRILSITHLVAKLLGLVENSKWSNPCIVLSILGSERGRASFSLLPKLTSF